jgi:pilus assembly protein CpaC
VLGGNRIRLLVAPEVSTLSNIGAVEIQGFSIPSVMTRRSETTLELQSGQTFAMAGLLNQDTNARNSQVPLLGDLPILGSLFRSVSYKTGESELVVLVTASLVEPVSHDTPRPLQAELHVEPNDWDLFLNGAIEGKADASISASEIGLDSIGFDRLKGPGGWASHFDQ